MSNIPWGKETERAEYWNSAWKTENKDEKRLQAELNKYKQDEANGLHVRLPCKVGDTVWVVINDYYISLEKRINKGIITRIVLIPDSNVLCIQFHNGYGITEMPFEFENIGKTVFLTKEDAKKALEGLKK